MLGNRHLVVVSGSLERQDLVIEALEMPETFRHDFQQMRVIAHLGDGYVKRYLSIDELDQRGRIKSSPMNFQGVFHFRQSFWKCIAILRRHLDCGTFDNK